MNVEKWLVVIKVDTNDADYAEGIYVVDSEGKAAIESAMEKLQSLTPKSDSSHYRDGPEKMYGLSTKEVGEMEDALSVSVMDGFHTYESVTFYPLAGEAENHDLDVRWNCQW